MLKNFLIIALITLISTASISAGNVNNVQDRAEKMKVKIEKFAAANNKKKVNLKLRDNTAINGHITEVKDSSFLLVNSKTVNEVEIYYDQVNEVAVRNWPVGARIALWTGVTIAMVAAVAVLVGDQ